MYRCLSRSVYSLLSWSRASTLDSFATRDRLNRVQLPCLRREKLSFWPNKRTMALETSGWANLNVLSNDETSAAGKNAQIPLREKESQRQQTFLRWIKICIICGKWNPSSSSLSPLPPSARDESPRSRSQRRFHGNWCRSSIFLFTCGATLRSIEDFSCFSSYSYESNSVIWRIHQIRFPILLKNQFHQEATPQVYETTQLLFPYSSRSRCSGNLRWISQVAKIKGVKGENLKNSFSRGI